MNRKKRVKAAPFTLWLIPGFLISVSLLVVSFLIAAVAPWGIFGNGGPGPPEQIDPPLVPGVLGWFVVIVTVGFTGIGIWLDRGQEKRIEPLARVSACLSVLGIAEAISVANAMACSNVWPVRLIDVTVWILVAAMAVGVLSLIRLLVARGKLCGWVFATCSILCSACSLWHVHTALVNFYAPLPEDGIELPVVNDSWQDWPDPGEYRPELRIGVGGPEELPDLAEVAERMAREPYSGTEIPDEPVLIRADARAHWSSVRDVIAGVDEVGIWKVQIATRWQSPATQTKLLFYLHRGARPGPEVMLALPRLHVQLHGEGRSSLNGATFETTDALVAFLGEMAPEGERREPRMLWIDPKEDVRWQEILSIVEAWKAQQSPEVQLGDLYFNVE